MRIELLVSVVMLYCKCEANISTANAFPTKTYYFENKPFIYTENGTATGMIVHFFKELEKLGGSCFNSSNTQIMTFERTSGREKFQQMLYEHFKDANLTRFNETMIKNWAPVIGEYNITSIAYGQFDLLFTEHIAVIRTNGWINMNFKFLISLYNLIPFLSIISIYAGIFGMIIWLAVREKLFFMIQIHIEGESIV